jgi:triosephosphate isomerase
MEKSLVVANWKENKTVEEAKEWLEKFSATLAGFSNQNHTEVAICPSYVVLPMMAYEISKLEGVKLGAQDVSKFEEGAYTGEVSAKQLKDFVSYVIVGHSERRRYFGETDDDVAAKSLLALKYNLIPIVCVSSVEEARDWKLEAGKEGRSSKLDEAILVYEPLEAISREGEYHPADPEHAQKMAQKIRIAVGGEVAVLYGGSVNAKNVESFVRQPAISGVLVGHASLNAQEFAKVIRNSF